jgi:hypothetical protein
MSFIEWIRTRGDDVEIKVRVHVRARRNATSRCVRARTRDRAIPPKLLNDDETQTHHLRRQGCELRRINGLGVLRHQVGLALRHFRHGRFCFVGWSRDCFREDAINCSPYFLPLLVRLFGTYFANSYHGCFCDLYDGGDGICTTTGSLRLWVRAQLCRDLPARDEAEARMR